MMKKMIIAIAVLAAVAFTTYLGLQAAEPQIAVNPLKVKPIVVNPEPKAALLLQINNDGYVIWAMNISDRQRVPAIEANGSLGKRRTAPGAPCIPCPQPCNPPNCLWRLDGGYWRCCQR
jgi:hypothetical protein